MTAALWITVLLLAFANGANDNAKGVATLRGSGLASETAAILWGTAWTFVGALLSAKLGARLISLFNGRGLFPMEVGRLDLPLIVAMATAAAVLLASRLGAPISTTYALTGALVGVGAASFGVASTMVFGGIVGARRVARTLSEKIIPMDPLQGFAANLITSILVSGASQFALPVSTSHVACGSLFGISLLRGGESNRRQILQILFAWGVTLPLAAFLAISFYLIRIWL